MLRRNLLCATLIACVANVATAQGTGRVALTDLEWGDARSRVHTTALRKRAAALTKEEAAQLRAQLKAHPRDISTRMVLLFHELPELRRKRGERHDPQPHGRLVLGLIEQHPRSRLAGTAGLLLYPYKRDGMYTGPAWEDAIELWEHLVAMHPKDPAIACNAGSFLMADPFRIKKDGPRALVLLRRARELAPQEPRWALKLGAYHSMLRSMTRAPEARMSEAKAALPHLRAAWDLTAASERGVLVVMGKPLSMALASVYFDAGEAQSARTFAALALEQDDPQKPRGDLVFEMNVVLGRIALAEGDVDEAARYLLAAGWTTGSPVLGSFGPDMTLAEGLLAAGKRDTVREFLESCKAFWDSGQSELDAWIRAIDEGGNPWEDPPLTR